MRACVIFNPTARGEKARRFRHQLEEIGRQCALKATRAVDDGRKLAAEAIAEGFDTIVAAGGDGTVNEVLNGIGDAPNGFQRACLGVLPLGTVNVLARELLIPPDLDAAWEVIKRGKEANIDLPMVEYNGIENGARQRRYFVQLAGAGLDARAIKLVKWQVKKLVGPLAYVLAGLEAVLGSQSAITVQAGGRTETGELVMIGNGRLYGGEFKMFPDADLRDGKLEVCVLRKADFLTLVRATPSLLWSRQLPASSATVFRTEAMELQSSADCPLQVDGELIGHLPARMSVARQGLRIVVP